MSDSKSAKDSTVFVGDLLRRPGSRRDLDLAALIPDLDTGLVHIGGSEKVRCDFALESITDGVVVHGKASVHWTAECARCLEQFDGETTVGVDELFEPTPTEGDTYLLVGEEIDLEQMLRDTLVTEFPLAPLPPSDHEGRCRVCGRRPEELPFLNEPAGRDERWRALDALDL
jgi:DUF177 domain-containing protein